MKDIVTIRTPQFKEGKIDRYHTQKGTIQRNVKNDPKNSPPVIFILFTPLNGFVNGDHPVWFHSEKEFETSLVSIETTEFK